MFGHCSEPLRLIALLGLVKPSTFTEAHETEPEQTGCTVYLKILCQPQGLITTVIVPSRKDITKLYLLLSFADFCPLNCIYTYLDLDLLHGPSFTFCNTTTNQTMAVSNTMNSSSVTLLMHNDYTHYIAALFDLLTTLQHPTPSNPAASAARSILPTPFYPYRTILPSRFI
jgi:hypothetical protein